MIIDLLKRPVLVYHAVVIACVPEREVTQLKSESRIDRKKAFHWVPSTAEPVINKVV